MKELIIKFSSKMGKTLKEEDLQMSTSLLFPAWNSLIGLFKIH